MNTNFEISQAIAAAAFLLGMIIDWFKPDKVQEWLDRCCWGNKGNNYNSMNEEIQQLALAMGN